MASTGFQPIRKTGVPRISVYGFYAFRAESSIEYESSLERDFMVCTEFDLTVLDVRPKPCKIPFHTAPGSRTKTYTPDFLVHYRLGDMAPFQYPKPLLVEVKPEEQWQQYWRKWKPEWNATRQYAKEQGWMFQVHDESKIRGTLFQNVTFLECYKRQIHSLKDEAEVIETLAFEGSMSVSDLLLAHFEEAGQSVGLALLWHLLAKRVLDCDMHISLSESTELWIPDSE